MIPSEDDVAQAVSQWKVDYPSESLEQRLMTEFDLNRDQAEQAIGRYLGHPVTPGPATVRFAQDLVAYADSHGIPQEIAQEVMDSVAGRMIDGAGLLLAEACATMEQRMQGRWVWLVVDRIDYHGSEPVRAFATEAEAEAFATSRDPGPPEYAEVIKVPMGGVS